MKLDDLIEILKSFNEFNDVNVEFDKLTFPDLKVVLTPYENYSTMKTELDVSNKKNEILNDAWFPANSYQTMNDCGPVSWNSFVSKPDTILTETEFKQQYQCNEPTKEELNTLEEKWNLGNRNQKQKHQCHKHFWKEK